MLLRPTTLCVHLVDLGSGTGRGVFAAAFLHDFDRCVGIEILDGLAGLSKAVLQVALRWLYPESWVSHQPSFLLEQRYQTQFRNAMPGVQSDSKETKSQGHPTSIEVAAGDFLRIDWSDADVIYINSTWYGDAFSSFSASAHLWIECVLMQYSSFDDALMVWYLNVRNRWHRCSDVYRSIVQDAIAERGSRLKDGAVGMYGVMFPVLRDCLRRTVLIRTSAEQ